MSDFNLQRPENIDTDTLRWAVNLILDAASRQDVNDGAKAVAAGVSNMFSSVIEPWHETLLEQLLTDAETLADKLPSGEDALNAYINTRETLQEMIDDLDQFDQNQSK